MVRRAAVLWCGSIGCCQLAPTFQCLAVFLKPRHATIAFLLQMLASRTALDTAAMRAATQAAARQAHLLEPPLTVQRSMLCLMIATAMRWRGWLRSARSYKLSNRA